MLVGFVCLVDEPLDGDETPQGTQQPRMMYIADKNTTGHVHTDLDSTDINATDSCNMKVHLKDTADMYVFAKQGKSRHTGLWNLDLLIKSCENLQETGVKIQSDISNYIVPTDLRAGLAGQIIVLQK